MPNIETMSIKVLDDGFVRLVDVMGNDSSIVQAARVSYGSGTKQVSNDRNLIRYLMRHAHSTPFEMCLAGDTLIHSMPCPGASRKSYTLKQIADAFAEGGKHNSWVKNLHVRTVNEDGKIVGTKIRYAGQTGIKPAFELTTEGPLPRQIIATSNHPFLTPSGYCELCNLSVGEKIISNGISELNNQQLQELWNENWSLSEIGKLLGTSRSTVVRMLKAAGIDTKRRTGFLRKHDNILIDPRSRARRSFDCKVTLCEICRHPATDIHHLDENPWNNNESNLIPLCKPCHKAFHNDPYQLRVYPTKVASIEPIGEIPVFDLEVESDNHNFVANGLVVHNCEFKFHIRVPMDCWRQWIRHRMSSTNEYSTRYSEAIDAAQRTPPNEWRSQAKINKQGSGEYIDVGIGASLSSIEQELQEYARSVYEERLKLGVAREQARKDLPLSTYTEAYWKIDLHNLFHFLKLRLDSHAQLEIRQYAQALANLIKPHVPIAFEAFEDYRLNALTFTGPEIAKIKAHDVTPFENKREQAEFEAKLNSLGIKNLKSGENNEQ